MNHILGQLGYYACMWLCIWIWKTTSLDHFMYLFLRSLFLCLPQSILFMKKLSLRHRLLQTLWKCCSLPLHLKDCRWTCLCKGFNLNLVPIFSGSGKHPSFLYLNSGLVHSSPQTQLLLSMLKKRIGGKIFPFIRISFVLLEIPPLIPQPGTQ